MSGFTALERLFLTDRVRQRAASTGFSIPAMQEVKIDSDAQPLLASNMRGTFIQTRRGAEGQARFGFFPCQVEDEAAVLLTLYSALDENSRKAGWGNRCRGIEQSIEMLSKQGLAAKTVVVSEPFLAELMDSDVESARRLQKMQGYVAIVDGMQVLLSDLPKGAAIVAADPKLTGLYTRVGDHLGLLAQRIDRAFVVVADDVA